jgi:hypothetical protein
VPPSSVVENTHPERAAAALDLVGRDPRLALAAADAVVAAAAEDHDPGAVSTAHRAAGLALRELGSLTTAEARLRTAVRVATLRPDILTAELVPSGSLPAGNYWHRRPAGGAQACLSPVATKATRGSSAA